MPLIIRNTIFNMQLNLLKNISSGFSMFLMMVMIIAPNSRAHKGEKERGEVTREYGWIWGED